MSEDKAEVLPVLDRKAIRGLKDARMEKVEVPQWAATVWVRTLKAVAKDDFDNYMARLQKARKASGEDIEAVEDEAIPKGARALLVALATCYEDGSSFFQPGDEVWLAEKDSEAIEAVFMVALRLNKLGKNAVDQAVKS